MYAETGLLFPCFQSFSPEIYNLDDFYQHQKPMIPSLNNGTISEYDLGTESDLFKAPHPLIEEEPNRDLDPMAAAIAMMNSGEDVAMMTPPQDLKFSGMVEEESLHQPLLSEVFYECRKDLLAIELQQQSLIPIGEEIEPCDVFMQKSVSSGCLRSMEFSGVDLGMRRVFSEGDIQTLGRGNPSSLQPLLQPTARAEERREQLCRYRNKKMKRNFGRKIKYACRKALADSQPRIRGRFAKTEDQNDSLKKFY